MGKTGFEAKFKVGDRVRVKADIAEISDGHPDADMMIPFAGQIVTIDEVHEFQTRTACYQIKEDEGFAVWYEEYLEPA